MSHFGPNRNTIVKSDYIYEDTYFQTGSKGGVPAPFGAQLRAPAELDSKIDTT